MIEKWDKVVYDRFIDGHLLDGMTNSDNIQDVYECIDWLYHNKPGETKMLQALDRVNALKIQKKLCEGNAFKSVNTTYQIMRHMQTKQDEMQGASEHEYDAMVQNLYTSKRVQEDLESDADDENLIDALVRGQSTGCSYQGQQVSQEDLEFRKWLFSEMKANEDLKEIMDCFGQFYTEANVLKRQKYTTATANVSGAELGNEIAEVFDDELLGLVVPELQNLFMFEYAQEQLMQYEYTQKVDTGEGDLTLMIDTSGSMEAKLVEGGSKIINMAIGFAMAMIKVLAQDGRAADIWTFDERAHFKFSTKDMSTQQAIQKLVSIKCAGGTNLQRAFGMVCGSTDDDVVMITDAQDGIMRGDEMKDMKGERRFSCLLVTPTWVHQHPQRVGVEQSPLKVAADSFIMANDQRGFDHLIPEII